MKNRRRGPDFIINMVKWISVVLWIVIAGVFFIIVIMKPTSSALQVSRVIHGTSSRMVTEAIFWLLVLQLVLSVAGIIFNMTRLKRKTDTVRLTFIFSIIISVSGLILIKLQ